MKLKLTLLIFTLLCFYKNNTAQYSNLKLSDYTLPDLNYRELDTYFLFGNKNNGLFFPDEVFFLSTTSSYKFQLSFDYLRLKNTRAFQKRINISSNLNLALNDSQNQSGRYQESSQFSSSISGRQTNRKYIQPKAFREINYHLSTAAKWVKTNETSSSGVQSSSASHEYDFLLFVPIKVGKGRIDPVTDARHAIFILEKLKEEGHLQRDLEATEIHEFAEVISKLDYKRFFDFRHRLIYELKQVDSFLQSKNLITQTDINYFTQLNDMWRFGRGPIRQSGKRFTFAFYPGYNYINNNNNNNEDIANILAFNMGIEYDFEKPINLYWQNMLNVYSLTGLVGEKSPGNNFSSSDNLLIPKINIGATNKLGFYPNTRTQMVFTNGVHFLALLSEIDRGNDQTGINGYRINFNTGFNFDYYLSPRLRATVDLLIRYRLEKNTGGSSFSPGYDINNRINYLLNYPHCTSFDCQFGSEGKRFSHSFSVSVTYALF